MATDWHDRMRGIQFDMLYSALALADEEYYRDVTFQTLLEGGLNGLETVVTTDGLEDAFPGLKDRDQQKYFSTTSRIGKPRPNWPRPTRVPTSSPRPLWTFAT